MELKWLGAHIASLLFCCYLLLLPTPTHYFINVEIRLL